MEPLFSAFLETDSGRKSIEVYNCGVLDFDEPIDILTTSAYVGSYEPTRRTMFEALYNAGISVQHLARQPELDLREPCGVWLSRAVEQGNTMIRRIGCIELLAWHSRQRQRGAMDHSLIESVRAYFAMLDIADILRIPVSTVALPLLGSGAQGISAELMIVPLLNECLSLLRRNANVRRICFIEKNPGKSALIADYLRKSYTMMTQIRPANPAAAIKRNIRAFISYSSADAAVAGRLCEEMERQGIQVWYAPRDVRGAYAASIVEAIEHTTHFVVILSQHSMQSQHVLNEVDLAFQRLPNQIRFKPLRIDDCPFTPSMKYYLSRQHWMSAVDAPLDDRLEEFARSLLSES